MNLKKLRSIADKDSVKLSIDDRTGIVSVGFKYAGCSLKALYTEEIDGLFAFSLQDDPDAFFDAIKSKPHEKEAEQDD